MSTFRIKHKIKGIRPLYVHNGFILAIRGRSVYQCSLDMKKIYFIVRLPLESIRHFPSSISRLYNRVMRSTPSKSQQVNEHQFIIFRNSQIWLIDLISKTAQLEFVIPERKKALDCVHLNATEFEPMHVFGEYFQNPTRRPVSIWGRSCLDHKWRKMYTFPANEIEHIHAIVPDYKNNIVYILTGDIDNSAGIWVSNPDFTDFRPVLRGKQQYRAAWLSEINGRIIYATDTQYDNNGVYELRKNNNDMWESIKIFETDGTSIYYAKVNGSCFFSTAIEPGIKSGSFLKDLFDRKKSDFMISDHAKIHYVDEQLNIHEVLSVQKDWMPFRLGQFGSFTFPSGLFSEGVLVAYGIAVRGYDDVCLILEKI